MTEAQLEALLDSAWNGGAEQACVIYQATRDVRSDERDWRAEQQEAIQQLIQSI